MFPTSNRPADLLPVRSALKMARRGSVRLLIAALPILSVFVLTGCARQSYFQTHPRQGVVTRDPAAGIGDDPRALPMFAGVTQQPLDWQALLDAVAWANVIIIGEQHDDGMGHAVELAVAQDTLAQFPRSAISLEMLERDEQPLVDDYFDGIIDAPTFIKLTDSKGWAGEGSWEKWYQPVIDAAKNGGGRVVAANSPRRYVRLARTEGYDRLRAIPAPRRHLFDVPTTPVSEAYRKRFHDIMTQSDPAVAGPPTTAPATSPASTMPETAAATTLPATTAPTTTAPATTAPAPPRHGSSGDAAIEAGFRSQLVWDTTMATSIAIASRGGAPKVVHLIGQFHMDFEGGTVQQLRKRLPGARILTISMQRDDGKALREEDIDRADIIIYTGERPPEPETQPAATAPATTAPAATGPPASVPAATAPASTPS